VKSTISQLGIHVKKAPITPDHRCYRPASWPPPPNWVVSEDAQGNPLSRWIDPYWDYSPWAGTTFKLDFAGRSGGNFSSPLGNENQYLMRMVATWMIWGPKGDKTWGTLKARFGCVRRIVVLCEREGVLASDLMRYPKLLEQVPAIFSSSKDRQRVILTLDRLLRDKDRLGFTLVDRSGISALSKAFSGFGQDETEQTSYIPQRIWTYQVLRLKECLKDFLRHQQQIADCFNFCLDAYAHNFGTLEAALLATPSESSNWLPFTYQGNKNPGALSGRLFHGPFNITAEHFGIADLLEKWVLPKSERLTIKSMSAFLTLTQFAGQAYIANFTLQRIEETTSLRADCLVVEHDPVVGEIHVIRGETTKTDPDSDARWPTSPSVRLAVDAMTVVANLRIRCAAADPNVNCDLADQENPLLCHRAFEPWVGSRSIDYSIRPVAVGYREILVRFPRLFDPEELRITEEDLTKARMFTPNLNKAGKFEVGKTWPLGFHQLRRTGAINMFASGLLSDSSIQFLLKHKSLLQAIYYGQNHTRHRFNEDVEGLTIAAKYEVMAKQIESLVSDRYVSPGGPERKQEIVVNLMSAEDFKALAKAGERGEVSFRENRLGGCTKRGSCDYGGIESVARCAGGDGAKPCGDAVFDRLKRPMVERDLEDVEKLMQTAQAGSPRERFLTAERQGMRNYLDKIRN